MKPDGVDSGATEPMVALDADPVIQGEHLGEGQEPAPPASQTEETEQGEPQTTGTPTAATKSGKDKAADPKVKAKVAAKTKTSSTGARPGTVQSRLTNGVQKPAHANGLAKKTTTGAAVEKKATTGAFKKPVGTTGAATTKPASKTTEKKPTGAPKTTGTTQPVKKTTVNGDKAKPKPAATASRPATAVTARTSTTSSPKTDKPPVSKTTRPSTGTTTSRPASAAPKPAAPATSKTPTTASKTTPSAAKTTTTTAKPSPAKTPSAGRAPATSTKSPMPIKKDAGKPATPAAKKSTASPLTRPASTKTSKPDTQKAATPSKPESKKPLTPSKPAGEAKTSKPKESKPTPSKEINAAQKTSTAKNSAAKTASPKKVVGSSTPMPVKRGPKSVQKEKEVVAPAVENAPAVEAVAVAAAAAGAAGAFIAVTDNESKVCTELLPEIKPEVAPEPELQVSPEPELQVAPEPELQVAPEPELQVAPEPELQVAPEPVLQVSPEPELEVSPEPQLEVSPEPQLEVSPEPQLQVSPEYQLQVSPEPELQVSPEPELQVAPEPELQVAPEPELQVSPEPELQVAPEPELQVAPEPASPHSVEPESQLAPETKPELEPEPNSDLLLETESEFTAETMSELLIETRPALVPEARSDILLEGESEFMPETMPELLLETKPAVVPTSELPIESEYPFEHLPETKHEFAPEPQSHLPLEINSEFASKTKSEFLLETESELSSAPEPKSDSLFKTNFEFAPEPESQLLFEPESETSPEPESQLLFEPESEPAREPEFQSLFEPKPEPLPETVLEPTVESLITASVEEFGADSEEIPSDSEEETPEEVVPQQEAQLNLASFEHQSAPSTLGTTVMSPPSSPTVESPVHEEPQVSDPLQDVSYNPWEQNVPMLSSDITTENLEQEEIRVQEDLLATMESADVEKPFNLDVEHDLLHKTHLEHFSSVSPTSPSVEKEEAVEKAEEEINEDDHDEEEEEEEEEVEVEQQKREIVNVEAVPEMQKVDDFNFGLPEFSSSSGGVGQSEEFGRNFQQEQAEALSSFRMESNHSDEEEDFSLKKVEMEQPFMGPPGVKSFSDEEEEEEDEEEGEQEKEDMDTGPEHIDKGHVIFDLEQTGDHHMDVHHKSEEEEEHEDEDVEMVSEGQAESESKHARNVEEDDYEEDYLENLNRTAPAPSIRMTAAWGPSNPFADTWAQPTSINITSSPLDVKDSNPETSTKSPAETWLEKPLGHLTHFEVREEPESSIPVDGANLCAPAIGMSQSSTLSGTALAAHSSSETSTPEELRDYDSSSGVESRSDKQQTPVPTVQPDQDQDLGIHLERGDGEEEEAETLPADEVLGDAPTAPASVPSSPSTSGDEASDTEGEMQINDPDAPTDDTPPLDSPTASRNLPALEEDEEAVDMQAGEEDGGTPQSANSVASYGFDCSVSNSNAHSTAESCGKSPGIFSLENEDQLPDEAKDPSLIKELTLPAAAAQAEDLLGCPVDLLPLGQQGESHANPDDQYLPHGKTGASAVVESDPESPMHLSPQHGDGPDAQPPYYSTICDNTDSFLAGYITKQPRHGLQKVKYDNLPSLPPEVNGNQYLTLVQDAHQHYKPLINPLQQQKQPTSWVAELVRLPVACPQRASQLRRLEQHQLHLRHILQRQEQERQQRLWLEEERQRQELQKQLERQQALRQWQKQESQRVERQTQLQRQRQELLRLQLHQEHRQRRQLLQWQLELEQRFKRQQKAQSANRLSPSHGLCTIYEAMETGEDEVIQRNIASGRRELKGQGKSHHPPLCGINGNLYQPPQYEQNWNTKMDVVQKLINQALLLEGKDGCPPLLYLPGQGGGTLSPLESSSWPHIVHQFSHASATITSVCSYSPIQGRSPQDDWTVVELETFH